MQCPPCRTSPDNHPGNGLQNGTAHLGAAPLSAPGPAAQGHAYEHLCPGRALRTQPGAARRPREGRGRRKEQPKKGEKQPRARRLGARRGNASVPQRRSRPQPPPAPPPRRPALTCRSRRCRRRRPAPLAPHQTFSPLSPCFLAPRVTRAGADWRSRRRKAWRRGGGAGPAAN